MSSNLTAVAFLLAHSIYSIHVLFPICCGERQQIVAKTSPLTERPTSLSQSRVFASVVAEVVLDVMPKATTYRSEARQSTGTTSVVIRKNWNDTEKISMAPAQG